MSFIRNLSLSLSLTHTHTRRFLSFWIFWRYFGNFGGILVFLSFQVYFGQFLGFGIVLDHFGGLQVVFTFYRFETFFGHFLGSRIFFVSLFFLFFVFFFLNIILSIHSKNCNYYQKFYEPTKDRNVIFLDSDGNVTNKLNIVIFYSLNLIH